MDDRYGLMRGGSGLWRPPRERDYDEEDVWDVLTDRKDAIFPVSNNKAVESSVSVPRNFPTAARMIPRATSAGSKSSGSTSSHETKLLQRQSLPVNIPNWSMISVKHSKKTSNQSGLDGSHGGDEVVHCQGEREEADNDDYSEYNCKLPPHEFIARRLAETQISSFSVFEGVGRTLKGRDLSRVRNAILTKTGFLESL